MAKGFILGIVVAILLVAGGMYVYFSWGFAPVATSASPMPLERKLAKSALHAYLNKLPHPQPMVPADEANLIAGSKVYKEQCATCHGWIGVTRTGSNPDPVYGPARTANDTGTAGGRAVVGPCAPGSAPSSWFTIAAVSGDDVRP